MLAIDPITLNIVGKAILAIPREMGANLLRAAYSTVVREARDCSAALLDRGGNIIAQAEMIPMHLGGVSHAFQALARKFALDEVAADEALMINDPFDGGQHLQDIYLFTPIFAAGERVGFVASVAHHLDIGGGSAGLNSLATEFYQEGIRLPACKFNVPRDWNGGFVEEFIRANVRVPVKTIGDLNACFAANYTGRQRLQEVVAKYGVATTRACMTELIEYAERRTRAEIAGIPDGTYAGEAFVEAEPYSSALVPIRASVTVKGSDVHIDFTGSGPQVVGSGNCPYASCHSAAQAALRGVLGDKTIPFNEGCNRPLTLEVPYGSILNPRPPAAVRARMNAAFRAYNAVMGAFAQAVPDRVLAPGFDTTTIVALGHLDRERSRYDVVIEVIGGGWGAGPHNDGADGADGPLSNCSNAPVEALEIDHGFFRVRAYRLRPDSGGAGRQRGGLGFERSYEATRDGVTFSGYSDRFKRPAPGLFGGGSGTTGRYEVRRATGEVEELKSIAGTTLSRGDVLQAVVGGGGGFGPAAERAPEAVAADVRKGKITAEHARKVYGWKGDELG